MIALAIDIAIAFFATTDALLWQYQDAKITLIYNILIIFNVYVDCFFDFIVESSST